MSCAVDIYNKTGSIPCQKCGIDLLKKTGYVTTCSQFKCGGLAIDKHTLETWAKEQGKELTWNINNKNLKS